jgi:serine-type D-Ala-D-Ala carboxypeptidase
MLIGQEIDAIVTNAIERRIFPGAVVLVARGNIICHYAAYGSTMYDAPGSRAVDRTTIYDIASLTKMFTATAALRLIELGALGLHEPVASYLPDFRAPGITVWHLLTHTSGLDIRLSTLRHAGRPGLLAAVYGTAPARPPGTSVAYTNVNALLLGEIVAKVLGESLDSVLRTLVIAPLGLLDTLFCPPAALLPRIAPTEIDQDWRGALVHGGVHDESAHALGGVAGHAGLFSSIHDLYLFCRMWLDETSRNRDTEQLRIEDRTAPVSLSSILDPRSSGFPRLLSRETIAQACANQTAGLNVACGLGWMLERPNFMGAAPAGTFGHTGFTGPAIVVVPTRQLIVVLLSNRVYPRRGPPEHHAVTAAIVDAALRAAVEASNRM